MKPRFVYKALSNPNVFCVRIVFCQRALPKPILWTSSGTRPRPVCPNEEGYVPRHNSERLSSIAPSKSLSASHRNGAHVSSGLYLTYASRKRMDIVVGPILSYAPQAHAAPFGTKHRFAASQTAGAGAAAAAAELPKFRTYKDLIDSEEMVLMPIEIDSYVALGPHSRKCLAYIGCHTVRAKCTSPGDET